MRFESHARSPNRLRFRSRSRPASVSFADVPPSDWPPTTYLRPIIRQTYRPPVDDLDDRDPSSTWGGRTYYQPESSYRSDSPESYYSSSPAPSRPATPTRRPRSRAPTPPPRRSERPQQPQHFGYRVGTGFPPPRAPSSGPRSSRVSSRHRTPPPLPRPSPFSAIPPPFYGHPVHRVPPITRYGYPGPPPISRPPSAPAMMNFYPPPPMMRLPAPGMPFYGPPLPINRPFGPMPGPPPPEPMLPRPPTPGPSYVPSTAPPSSIVESQRTMERKLRRVESRISEVERIRLDRERIERKKRAKAERDAFKKAERAIREKLERSKAKKEQKRMDNHISNVVRGTVERTLAENDMLWRGRDSVSEHDPQYRMRIQDTGSVYDSGRPMIPTRGGLGADLQPRRGAREPMDAIPSRALDDLARIIYELDLNRNPL
ncbi:hypothetical protein B0T17DRAFT_189043 [Bombardia bombarda]|uniref:Uncharacterized protein n=1 Tax=Bombardia bombarda TaxID=252184 RepID=A0AA39X8Y9_9PEZI|nr:hypothetical protein B0T17DRAFT_189043 [Bombardia bombarda]